MLRYFAPVLGIALAFAACSDDGDSNPAPTSSSDAGSSNDTGTSPGNDSGTSTTKTVNGCSSYADGTTVAWDISIKPPASCLKVKKGGSVTWNGDFTVHPLKPSGGDSPNPISTTTSGNSKSFTFDTVGTFGYVCGNHPSMTGAIQVVE